MDRTTGQKQIVSELFVWVSFDSADSASDPDREGIIAMPPHPVAAAAFGAMDVPLMADNLEAALGLKTDLQNDANAHGMSAKLVRFIRADTVAEIQPEIIAVELAPEAGGEG